MFAILRTRNIYTVTSPIFKKSKTAELNEISIKKEVACSFGIGSLGFCPEILALLCLILASV